MLGTPGRLSTLALGVAALMTLTACGGGGADGGDNGDWAGTIEDSAGVSIVRNPENGIWTEATTWRISEQLRIGEAEGDANYQFGQIASLDVDSDGNIYVLDQLGQRVQAYDSAGTYLRTLGRPGSGPGELSQATSAVIVTGDTVLVPDVMQQRATRFTREGAIAPSFPLRMTDGIPMRWGRTPDGRLVQQTRIMPFPNQPADAVVGSGVILRRDAAGQVLDTLMTLPATETFTMEGNTPRIRIFASEPIWAVLEDGRLSLAMNDAYRVEIRDESGELERVVVRQVEGSDVSDSDKQVLRERMQEIMSQQGAPPAAVQMITSSMEFADRFPVLSELLGGPEGTLWVQRVRPVDEMDFSGAGMAAFEFGARQWDVYDREGRLLGAVELPERFRPIRVIGDDVFGVQRDELDVQYVVRLRVERPAA